MERLLTGELAHEIKNPCRRSKVSLQLARHWTM
jgi:hypothetical protein